MGMLTGCISNATSAVQEPNEIVVDNTAVTETECINGIILPIEIKNDLSTEEKKEDINAEAQEPEESFIHPMILEKLNNFLEQAKTQFGQTPSAQAENNIAAGTEQAIGSEQQSTPTADATKDVSLSTVKEFWTDLDAGLKSETAEQRKSETAEQSWFDTTDLKKQVSTYFNGGNTAEVSPEEDARNDSAEADLALDVEEVRQDVFVWR